MTEREIFFLVMLMFAAMGGKAYLMMHPDQPALEARPAIYSNPDGNDEMEAWNLTVAAIDVSCHAIGRQNCR